MVTNMTSMNDVFLQVEKIAGRARFHSEPDAAEQAIALAETAAAARLAAGEINDWFGAAKNAIRLRIEFDVDVERAFFAVIDILEKLDMRPTERKVFRRAFWGIAQTALTNKKISAWADAADVAISADDLDVKN